jgi:hypothetical protein
MKIDINLNPMPKLKMKSHVTTPQVKSPIYSLIKCLMSGTAPAL